MLDKKFSSKWGTNVYHGLFKSFLNHTTLSCVFIGKLQHRPPSLGYFPPYPPQVIKSQNFFIFFLRLHHWKVGFKPCFQCPTWFLILVYITGPSASGFAQPSAWVTLSESLLQHLLRAFLLSSHCAVSPLPITSLSSWCNSPPLLSFENITSLTPQYWCGETQLPSYQSCLKMTLKHFSGYNASQGCCLFISERFQ